jgi:hypothetical protein
MENTTTLAREELYNLVWSEPVSKLAKRFGLSDQGLAKKCARHNIPRPPLGYWAKIQHGYKVSKTPLPKNDDQYLETVTFWPKPEKKSDEENPIRHQLTDEQLATALSFKFPQRVNHYHESILSCRNDFSSNKDRWGIDNYGRINFSRSVANPGFKVSPKTFGRACRLLQGMIKLFGSFGWEYVRIKTRYGDKDDWGWKVGEETLRFEIKEPSKKVKSEQALNKSRVSSSLYLSVYTRQEYRPTGVLEFSIEIYSPSFQVRWKDNGADLIEDHIADIAISFSKAFEHERLKSIEREAQHTRWEEEERKRTEKRRLIEIEEKRREQLIALANRHDTLTKIRNLINEIRSQSEQEEKLSEWLSWAETVVADIDPLQNIDSILEEFKEIAEKPYC